MNPTLIHTFDDRRTAELLALYQGEWWSRERTLADVQTMLAHCPYVFGFSHPETGQLIAFARVLTDRIFKAFLFDVIVHPAHRDQGLGRAMIRGVLEHPDLREVRHFELYCVPERVEYYRSFGFSDELNRTITLMRRVKDQK